MENNMKKNFKATTRIAATALAAVMMFTGCSSADGLKAVKEALKGTESSTTSVENNRTISDLFNGAADVAEYPSTTSDSGYSSMAPSACMDTCCETEEGYYAAPAEAYPEYNTEEYLNIEESGFKKTAISPLSTFAADVDTGSFCNLRRMFRDGYTVSDIPTGAIRTEELINYFDYSVNNRSDGKFSVGSEIHTCPWNPEHGLLMMTALANETDGHYEGNNFVFLIDSSGSMYGEDRIELVKKSFKMLAETLTVNDRVSIVTYSGDFRTIIDGAAGNEYRMICRGLDSIEAEGCTWGEGGINAAYECAMKHFIEGGNNRVIIASDGDMNLGVTSTSGLVDLIKEKKESGIFLTVLGYGSGNYSDANMESIADAGNGNYYYIDCEEEAKNVLINKLKQTTVTVAKDVKFQAEFNPLVVSEYRLIGYENRTMAAEDFADDTKDGGEVGAGQQVTVCYEIVYADGSEKEDSGLKYQNTVASEEAGRGDILTLSVRYKEPSGETSKLEEYVVEKPMVKDMTLEVPVADIEGSECWETGMSEDYCLATGLIEVSMLLRGSEYTGNANWDAAVELISRGVSNRPDVKEMFEDIYDQAWARRMR